MGKYGNPITPMILSNLFAESRYAEAEFFQCLATFNSAMIRLPKNQIGALLSTMQSHRSQLEFGKAHIDDGFQ